MGGRESVVGFALRSIMAVPLKLRDEVIGVVYCDNRFMAALFTVTGLFALLWGAAHVWVATLLRRRHPLGRLLGLAQALVNLLILPFGTALGIYALWVLLTNEGGTVRGAVHSGCLLADASPSAASARRGDRRRNGHPGIGHGGRKQSEPVSS